MNTRERVGLYLVRLENFPDVGEVDKGLPVGTHVLLLGVLYELLQKLNTARRSSMTERSP
jgi:hypothetical protein